MYGPAFLWCWASISIWKESEWNKFALHIWFSVSEVNLTRRPLLLLNQLRRWWNGRILDLSGTIWSFQPKHNLAFNTLVVQPSMPKDEFRNESLGVSSQQVVVIETPALSISCIHFGFLEYCRLPVPRVPSSEMIQVTTTVTQKLMLHMMVRDLQTSYI